MILAGATGMVEKVFSLNVFNMSILYDDLKDYNACILCLGIPGNFGIQKTWQSPQDLPESGEQQAINEKRGLLEF